MKLKSVISFSLFFISLLFQHKAVADWVHIASTLNDDAVFYVSSGSIKKTGIHTRTVWEVVNHPHRTRQGYLSAKVQQEYDCKSDRVRMLSASSHSELFGKGSTLETTKDKPLPWQTMPKNSVAAIVRDYVCSQNL